MADPRIDGQPGDGRVPLGSLGRVLAAVLSPLHTACLVATALIAVVVAAVLLPALAFPLADALGVSAAVWIIGVVGWTIFVLATAVVAIVPPLLLPARDRAIFAVHSWIGAREIRRVTGRAWRAIGLPRDARTAERWLARTPASDRNRIVRVGAFILVGRLDAARTEAQLLPTRTPLEGYRKLETFALLADRAGDQVDEEALRAAAVAIPEGVDRAEALASLAVLRARRALPDGDWRAPLLEVRPMIKASDLRVLVADFGLPVFETLVRLAILPFTVLLIAIALAVTLLPRPG